MLLVNPSTLSEGMILSSDLIGKNGQVFLLKNTVLNNEYILKIKNLNYNGVYIKDSNNPQITEVASLDQIQTDIKVKLFNGIKTLMVEIEETNELVNKENIIKISNVIYETVHSLICNKTTMINFIDLKISDELLFFHSINVAITSLVLGIGLKLDKNELYKLGMAAILHDLGKVLVDKKILSKPVRLTDSEFEEIKKHPMLGFKLLQNRTDIPLASKLGVLYHHEKWNGLGYVSGLKENSINIFSQIISIADIYDALISNRTYNKALTAKDATKIIKSEANKSFSPTLVKLFCTKIAIYPLGSIVKLNNNWEGTVLRNFEGFLDRPVIRVFKINDGYVPSFELDLKNDNRCEQLSIIECDF